MTAHADSIAQAEDRSGVNDDNPVEVGDLVADPANEDLPDGTVLIDEDGLPWKTIGSDWYLPAVAAPGLPHALQGPFEVVWLPKEEA